MFTFLFGMKGKAMPRKRCQGEGWEWGVQAKSLRDIHYEIPNVNLDFFVMIEVEWIGRE